MRRYGDVVLAVVLAVGYAVEVTAYSGRLSVWAVPVGIVSALALAGRRRHPVLVYAVSFAGNVAISYELAPRFQANSVFAVAVFLVGLYSMGAYARGVEAWWGGGFVLASMAALALQDGDHSPAGLFFFLVFVGVPWGAGVVVRLRHDRVAELDRRNAALQEEAQRAVGAERARLARELHDVVSHAIAVSVLQARGGSRLVGRDDAAVREALAAIERTNTAALADMRRLLGLLRDADDDFGRAEPAPSLERLTGPARAGHRLGTGRRPDRRRHGPTDSSGSRPVRIPDRPGGPHQRAETRRTGRSGPGMRGVRTARRDGRGVQHRTGADSRAERCRARPHWDQGTCGDGRRVRRCRSR